MEEYDGRQVVGIDLHGEPRVFRTVRYWPISGGELAVQVLVVDLVWGLVGECRVESF